MTAPLLLLDDPAPHVRRLTLNRPEKRNALSNALRGEIFAALEAADSDPEVRVIVLRGAGTCFSSGYDLAGVGDLPFHTAGGQGQWARHVVEGCFRIWDLAKPVIAQVHGWCLAGGSELAFACDLVYVAEDAQVGYPAMDGMKHAMAPNSCSPTWAQPSSTGAKIYVACNKADEIIEVDRDTWTISRRIKTGRGPYNLGVTPDGTLLLATLKQGAKFEIYDLATGVSVAQLANSTTIANGVAVTPDSKYAFVSSEGVGAAPGKVDVYDLKARARVATVDVGQQAGGIAFWKMEPAKP